MRTIELRVWDKAENEFGELSDYKSSSDWFLTAFQKEIPDSIVVQQWTGLVDVDSKDIYEGDIVKFRYEVGERDWMYDYGEVFFEDAMFLFGRTALFSTLDSNFDYDSLKVIGHIYEEQKTNR